jgi:hypothetical protein
MHPWLTRVVIWVRTSASSASLMRQGCFASGLTVGFRRMACSRNQLLHRLYLVSIWQLHRLYGPPL